MSIRTKILLLILAVVAAASAISVFVGFKGFLEHEQMAMLAGKAIEVGDVSRKAHDNFDRIGELIAEVTAMTHLIDRNNIEQRFRPSAAATAKDLASLQADALSPEMSNLAKKAIERFTKWTGQAEVLLGLSQAKEITALEVMKGDGDAIKSLLNEALALAGQDARTRIAEAGATAKVQIIGLLILAGGLFVAGIAGAYWLAHNFTEPLRQLVANAEKLASGDVSVTFAASVRRDEIGEVSRAVARFRDNVLAAQTAEAESEAAAQAQLKHARAMAAEEETSSRERAQVTKAVGTGLEQLAAKNLTYRLTQDFPEAYRKLKADFNAALEQIEQAVQQVRSTTHTIHGGAQEISIAADDLSRRTGQQESSLEQTASCLAQINVTVKKTTQGVVVARDAVATAKADAEKSAAVVRRSIEAMTQIEASSRQIGQIIGVIDEIAFQTNLLALNAGVEAARAGDAGRGFAVVASEVRALAQRTAEAAKEIKSLISMSTVQVHEGVDLVAETGKALDRIVGQVSEVNDIVSLIATSAQDQAVGLDQVSTAANEMNRATEQSAALVQKTTTAAHSLAQGTEELDQLIGRFQVGGAPMIGQARAARRLSQKSQPVLRRALKTFASAVVHKEEVADWEEF